MAQLTYTIVHRGGARGFGLKYLLLEVAQADSADTVDVSEFDNAVKDTVCLEMDTGAELACTESGTTITVGGAVTNKPLTILVSGY